MTRPVRGRKVGSKVTVEIGTSWTELDGERNGFGEAGGPCLGAGKAKAGPRILRTKAHFTRAKAVLEP